MDYQGLVIIIAILLTVTIGIDASRGVHTLRDYALSKGFFGIFSLTCTLVATYIGGGTIIGLSEDCFNRGITSLLGPLGFFTQLIIIGLFIAPRFNKHENALTLGDLMEKKYGTSSKVSIGVLWLIYCIGLMVIQTVALSTVLETFTHFSMTSNVILGTGMVVLYSSLGGIRAVVKTDVIQFCILSLCLPLALGFSIYYLGGVNELFSRLPTKMLQIEGNYTQIELGSIFLSFLCGGFLVPPVVQRIMIAKCPKIARKTYLISGVICFPFIIMGGLFGITAYAFNPEIPGSQAVPYLFNTILPIWLRPFAVSGLVAVIMSTADSYLNSSSIACVHDVIKPCFSRPLAPHTELRLAKLSSVAIGIISVVITIFFYNTIIHMMLYTFMSWGPTVVVPFTALLFDIVISKRGFYTCIILGLSTSFFWEIFHLKEIYHIGGLLPGITANLLTFTTLYIIQETYKAFVAKKTSIA